MKKEYNRHIKGQVTKMIEIENKKYRVMDAHTHIYPERIAERAVDALGKFYDFVPEGDGTYGDLLKQGADGFILLCVATNPGQVTKVNDYVAEKLTEARRNGIEAHAFAGIHQDFADKTAELERCRRLGFEGVKIHPDIQGVHITDPRFCEVYEWLNDRKMAITFHVGDDRPEYPFSKPAEVLIIAEKYPDLRICASHMGGYKEDDRSCALLAGVPNVFVDISSSLWHMTPERAEYLVRLFGDDKVMFGTDYPVKRMEGELERFEKLRLPSSSLQKIFWDNAQRFLKG